MKKVLVLNGPNLNLLGLREEAIYGSSTLSLIQSALEARARAVDYQLTFMQSNHEGELIDAIHRAKEEAIDFILINPAALTHTSIALRDALLAVAIPFIEVHISNIYARESFRHHSYLSDIAKGVISGLGAYGYQLAFDAIIHELSRES